MYYKISSLLLIVLMVLLNGCDSSELEPIPQDGVILAFGDSLTEGMGTSIDNSYPAVLARLTGMKVINAGISGETTDRGRQRLADELDQHSPDLLLLLEGGNDILQHREDSQTKANLKAMIEMALDRNIPVVLIGVPDKLGLSNSAALYHQLADEYQVIFAESLLKSLFVQPSLKSDYIHFNTEGYRKMAEGIHEILLDHGVLP